MWIQMTWNDIVKPADADELMRVFGREMHVWTGHWVGANLSMSCTGDLDTRLRILVQRQFRDPSAIELLFEQVTRLNLVPSPENYDSIIFGATLLLHDGEWFWSTDEGWSPTDSGRDQSTWVSARRLRWRDASAWMGEALRYGPHDAADGSSARQ